MPGISTILSASVVVMAVAAVSVGAGPSFAVSPGGYQVPELSFAVTGPGEVTATVRNPNGSGICWATIGIDGSVHEFAEHGGAGYAQAGQTIQVSRGDLAAGRYLLGGGCGATETDPHQVVAPTQEVTVPPDISQPPSGSFGS
ncbi:hypothetical protein [Nocardia sp. N2S4-5]|uniref:hypothetical protein n=1 Tax=Nocardia sp. N2S4-5 TaxID=3351565 RepID=UPI0037D085CF